ncbi:phosphoribosyltransferase [Dactylosporangium sp. NPDC051485]|uniref:phosphoribosyltransferase n=1 Tax=Dactylosporangium sp. NPDC051485 TaxID=3154846 RepID=UPI0034191240
MSNGSIPLRVALAERHTNDSRTYKILMSIVSDTLEFAIHPSELRAVAKALIEQLEIGPDLDWIIGFSQGGVPLAIAVAYELDIPLLIAYRSQMPLPDAITFREPHAFDDTFYLYGLTQGTVLLIDDEVDNGNTLANAVIALRDNGIRVADVAAGVEALHSGDSRGRRRLDDLGLNLKAACRFEIDSPAPEFLRGTWTEKAAAARRTEGLQAR